jgi:aldehyde:ferredoxin oxidoreductase
MYGWTGKRLRIDLTNHKHEIESLTADYCKKWIGGRGFNSEVVYHESWSGMDPFDPNNPLCFAPGTLSGTFAPCSGRTVVSARSPMTCSTMGTNIHGHGDTNMGGSFGPMLKYAGYDQLIVKGKAEKPVYLFINDDKIEFRDASHLWGKTTKQTTKMLMSEINDPDVKVVVIGPAGENLVRFACVINTYSSAGGRTGMGAVMGSKNLKAIVVKGSSPITIADPEGFKKSAWDLRNKIHSSEVAVRHGKLGSLELFDNGNSIGINAHKNCSTGYMKEMEEVYDSANWAKKFLFRRKACWSCPVACGRYTLIREGKYTGFNCGGPEMESLCNLGPRIDSLDIEGVTVMCGLANELGMDTVSAGAALSWTMEAFEKGYLTKEDTGGLQLDWADIDQSIKVLKMIANREGFGDVLAQGNIRAAEKMKSGADIVPHCRGLEHISVDPRIALGFSLGYAMSTRGSDHLKNYSCLEFPGLSLLLKDRINEVLSPEVAKKFWENFPAEMHEIETKPELCTWSEKNKCVSDLVGCCCDPIGSWGTAGSWKEAYAPLVRTATDVGLTDDEIFKAAERTICIERAHWLREGSGKQDDTHIDRYFDEEVSGGPYKGLKLDRDKWAWAQQEYYKLHGWDDAGFITPEKAEELGIEEIVPDMEKGKKVFVDWVKSRA